MEPKSTIRGKYKKHKEGFKIAIEYKLNTRLKAINDVDNTIPLYPLYIEVRAFRQMSFIKSFYNFYLNPSNFEAFLENDLARSLILNETEGIRNHLESYVRNRDKHGISLKDWLTEYKDEEYNEELHKSLRLVLFRKLESVSKNSIITNGLFYDLVPFGADVKHMLNLALLSRELSKANQLDELIEGFQAYIRLDDFFSSCSRDWLSPVPGLLFLSRSMTKFTVFQNTQIAAFLEENHHDYSSLKSDIEKVKSCLKN